MKLIIFLAGILLILTGCGQDLADYPAIDEPPETPKAVDIVTQPEPDAIEAAVKEPSTIMSENEVSLLSIDTTKIVYRIWFKTSDRAIKAIDDLGILKEMYPDIELIDLEYGKDYYGKYVGENYRNEYWHSEMSGLTYNISFNDDNDGVVNNRIVYMDGHAEDLITGLTASVRVSDFMATLGIPSSDWATGESPIAESYDGYTETMFWEVLPDDICFVIPDPQDEVVPIGVKVRPEFPGYVSPTDSIAIIEVGAFP